MQTLRLRILGSYYDSQIYSGRLYLWDRDGSIITIDWDKLIGSIRVPEDLKLVLICAFQMSEYLYGDHFKLILQDTEIKTIINSKFRRLAHFLPVDIYKEELYKHYIAQQDNPFAFPHSDCTIYSNTLYIGSQSGILAAECYHDNETPISHEPEKLWDGPALSVSAAYSALAISAGSEGLFELSLKADYSRQGHLKPRLLIKEHSNFARWLYASIFSSSYLNVGYLADFSNEKIKDSEERRRVFHKAISASDIFHKDIADDTSCLTWGSHDKICLATPKDIEVVRYNPRAKKSRFTSLGKIQTTKLTGLTSSIVSGDSALFGFIIESEDGLLVINSLMEEIWLEGEPINWRVFPKSKFYTNQLHVVYEDHLCIYSFNHDYLVDQKTKKAGIRYYPTKPNAVLGTSLG